MKYKLEDLEKEIYPQPNLEDLIKELEKPFIPKSKLIAAPKGFKLCNYCRIVKIEEDFNYNGRNAGGRINVCKKCKSIYYKERKKKLKPWKIIT